jgi:PEP-CTERM motif-containing protein
MLMARILAAILSRCLPARRRSAATIGLVAATFFLAALATTPAMAAPIVYTDREAFNAAVGETRLITFETFTGFQIPTRPYDAGFTYDNLVTHSGDIEDIAAASAGDYITFGLTFNVLPARLLEPVTAVGFDVTPLTPRHWVNGGELPLPPEALVVLVWTGDFTTYRVTDPQFLGFVFDATVDDLRVTGGDIAGGFARSVFSIDNMAVKTSVPEPALTTLLLLGAGGLGAARWVSRRRR